jgi:hypothetical protein
VFAPALLLSTQLQECVDPVSEGGLPWCIAPMTKSEGANESTLWVCVRGSGMHIQVVFWAAAPGHGLDAKNTII